jgi:hypothetical protein
MIPSILRADFTILQASTKKWKLTMGSRGIGSSQSLPL